MKNRTAVAGIASVALALMSLSTALVLPSQAAQPSVSPTSTGMMPSAVPSSITPAVNDGDVKAIAKVGGAMVIGGNFTSVAGQARSRIAAFDATTGAVKSFNPGVNGEVKAIIPGLDGHSVFIGGDFTQVGSTTVQDLALVDLNSGSVVPSFKPAKFDFGFVNDIVLRGSRLFAVGTFTKAGGVNHGGIVAMNATTGALDVFMQVQFTGHHNDSGSGAQGWVGPWNLDVTADGSKMVVVGNFKFADGLLRDQVAQIDLTGAKAAVRADWATSLYSPYCFNWAFDSYIRGVAYSPDGSYFAVTATGGPNPGTLCDSVVRWDTNAVGTNLDPTWINETGGDTVWAVTVTDTAVFTGGHNRWANNPLGSDYAGPGGVPRPGLMAVDPINGRPLKWNPGRNPSGKAVYALLATSEGLWVGSNTDWIGNRKYFRPKIALFPYAGGTTVAATNTGVLPGSVFMGGSQATGQSNVLYRVNAGGSAIQSLDSGPDWAVDTDSTSPYRNEGSNAAGWDPVPAVDGTVPATTPSAVFNAERWSPSDNPPMDWSFSVPQGTPLQVRLYFANRCTCTSQVGQRTFDVAIDGTRVLGNYDIVASVGDQTGTMRAFDVTSDGVVNIDFSHEVENPLINGIEIVRTDIPAPPPAGTDGLARVGFNGTSATAAQVVTGSGVAWGQTRGAFMAGNTVFYGQTDGYLYSRTFDGNTFSAATQINPYHDPLWMNVSDNLGSTYDGALPSLYDQFPNVTGMFYDSGKLYYTLFGDSSLRWRWFSTDSGIVDERSAIVPSSVNFNDADGMFIAAGKLYYVTKSNGNLNSVSFTGGAVVGDPAVVSGPSQDGVNWRNRSLFLYSGPAINQPPTAAFSLSCSYLACSFDGRASTDSDGTVASYAWDFGDGGSSTAASPAHTYAAAGSYTVTLTVTDNKGATNAVTHVVNVTAPPPNQPPTAAFTFTCQTSACSFVGSGSSDSDGTVASYVWDFGDGSSGANATASHTYVASGAYSATLTVTDNLGATGSVAHNVAVTVPASPLAYVGSAHSAAGSAKFKAAAVPAQTQVGDKLLLFLSTPSTVTWTGPTGVTGWTQVDSFTNGTVKSTLWQKTAMAGDLGKTVRVDDPTGFRLGVLGLAVYTGVDVSAPVVTAHRGDSGTASHVSPTLSAPSGSWVVSYWSDKSAATTQWTPPSGVTLRDSLTSDPGATRFSELLVDSGGPVPAGTYGGLIATTNVTSDKAVMWSVALTPASGRG